MNRYPSFENFQHNPWGFPNEEEKAAMLVFKRKERFVEGYSHIEELNILIKKFFGEINLLHQNGLDEYYEKLKKYVVNYNLIGLILIGTNLNNPLKLHDYKTIDNKIINLNTKDICRFLIKDYIKKENVDLLCTKTPNFNIYYKPENVQKIDNYT